MKPFRPIARNVLRRASPRSARPFATATDAPTGRQQPAFDQRVRIVEVAPRDGLQNEKRTIELETKIELIERLAKTGVSAIEAGSFVSPKWVPQMEASGQVLEHILKNKIKSPVPITYSFLAPNARGFADAKAILDAQPGSFTTESTRPAAAATGKPEIEIAVFAAATETFSQRNLNCDIQTSLERFAEVIQQAKDDDLRVRAYISVALGCPFEGYDVDPRRVAEIATDLLESGADEIAVGDTTGMGTAPRTSQLLRCLAAAGIRNEDIAMHFHDTYGQALVNTAVALEHGVRTFDCAVGGLGGCPYSPGATGNVATENMVYFMESLGMDTGVDLDAMADIGAWIANELQKPNDSTVGKAVLGARVRGQ